MSDVQCDLCGAPVELDEGDKEFARGFTGPIGWLCQACTDREAREMERYEVEALAELEDGDENGQ